MNILLGIALMSAQLAADAPVQVTTTLEPPVIPFHQQSRYTITVDAPAGTSVALPDMHDKMGGAPVSDIERNTIDLGKGRQRIMETYVLNPIFAATYAIYPVTVTYDENQQITVASPGLRVRDLTEEERKEAEQFAEATSPVLPPTIVERYWMHGAGAALACVAIIGGLAYALSRRKRREMPEPPLPAWEVAYRRLRELDERQLPQQGRYEAFYVDLSSILRYYIEDRFLLHAPEQTTPEFLSAVSASRVVSPEHQQMLAQFMRHSDYVKFAQYQPSVPEMEQSFATVLQFIDETVVRPEEAAPDARGGEDAA